MMFALGLDVLRLQRRSVILDSPAGQPPSTAQAQRVASEGDATLICILCLADCKTRNHRVANRHALRSQPVRISRTEGDGRERFDHLPDDTLCIDMTGPLAESVGIARAHIERVMSGESLR